MKYSLLLAAISCFISAQVIASQLPEIASYEACFEGECKKIPVWNGSSEYENFYRTLANANVCDVDGFTKQLSHWYAQEGQVNRVPFGSSLGWFVDDSCISANKQLSQEEKESRVHTIIDRLLTFDSWVTKPHAKIDINYETPYFHNTALSSAYERGFPTVAKLLIKHGARVTSRAIEMANGMEIIL